MVSLAYRTDIWLYAHPSMSDLAEEIVKRCTEEHTVSKESEYLRKTYERQTSNHPKRKITFQQKIQWKKFADGFPNLFIEDVKYMAGKDVIFLASFHSPAVIFEQLSIVYAIPRYLARSFTLILPYFPTATMERVDLEGQVATAKTLATLLSSIPMTARGPPQIMVFDIHALQERFYFSESVIPRLESAVPLLLRELKKMDEAPYICYPDDGAFKRFHSFFSDFNTVICNKVRQGDKRLVKLKEGDPKGKHVILVDDLVMTGGTLLESAKVLKECGASQVSAYATHAVFPNDSWRQFTPDNISNFWITDSLPHASAISKHKPFILLSLSDMIADTLLGYDLLQ